MAIKLNRGATHVKKDIKEGDIFGSSVKCVDAYHAMHIALM